jgi:hypothetical protein
VRIAGLMPKEEVPLWVAVSILPNKILVARKILIVDFSGRLNGTTLLLLRLVKDDAAIT